jgi:hypothetical protein
MPEKLLIQKDLFVAQPLLANTGWTYTLASRLGDMLYQAEKLFGPRDIDYTILGIEFRDGVPQIWYPGNRGHIIIQLTVQCLTDLHRACYQLAHECIHLLAPTGGQNANVLEDGLAQYFSELYIQNTFGVSFSADIQSYTDACTRVRRLLTIDQASVIKIRAIQPALHLVTADDVILACPVVPRSLAESLVIPFIR